MSRRRHVAEVIAWALNTAATEVEASADAETAWVDTVVAAVGGQRRAGEVLHAGLLQPRGPGEREDPAGQLLLRHPNRIRRHSRGVEGERRTGGVRDRQSEIRPDDQSPPIPAPVGCWR